MMLFTKMGRSSLNGKSTVFELLNFQMHIRHQVSGHRGRSQGLWIQNLNTLCKNTQRYYGIKNSHISITQY